MRGWLFQYTIVASVNGLVTELVLQMKRSRIGFHKVSATLFRKHRFPIIHNMNAHISIIFKVVAIDMVLFIEL